MKLPDGSILMHAGQPYDPTKAHEYYMRTRKLHPRQNGAGPPDGHGSHPPSAGPPKISPKQLAQQQAYAHQRVVQIKARLNNLTKELHDRLAAAKKREASANQAPTAADKTKKAQQDKKYRQTHKQELLNKRKAAASKSGGSSTSSSSSSSSSSSTVSTATLKKEIANTRDKLKAAVAWEHQLSAKKSG